jgi:hypothetical protein
VHDRGLEPRQVPEQARAATAQLAYDDLRDARHRAARQDRRCSAQQRERRPWGGVRMVSAGEALQRDRL